MTLFMLDGGLKIDVLAVELPTTLGSLEQMPRRNIRLAIPYIQDAESEESIRDSIVRWIPGLTWEHRSLRIFDMEPQDWRGATLMLDTGREHHGPALELLSKQIDLLPYRRDHELPYHRELLVPMWLDSEWPFELRERDVERIRTRVRATRRLPIELVMSR